MPRSRPSPTTLLPVAFALLILFTSLPTASLAQTATPCPAPNPCVCAASLLLSTLKSIPGTLLPPVAWTPVTDLYPVISNLLDRAPPTGARQTSFLREIESATDAMFASQFAAHTVTNNARIAWKRAQPLLEQIRTGACQPVPRLDPAPTADVFARRFPPTRTLIATLISYEALRTIIAPYKRALSRTSRLFSNFSLNEDIKTAVEAAVPMFEDIVESGFDEATRLEKFAAIDALDMNQVFSSLVDGWSRARRRSERAVFQAVADQVEPLRHPIICRYGPVNNVTCGICT